MKICFSNQMKRLDEISISEYGIPGVVLMENAGLAVFEELEKLNLPGKCAVVVCGTGNNGGDGYVVARHLSNKGWEVNVFICGDPDAIKGDALVNYRIIKSMGIPVFAIGENSIDFLEGFFSDTCLIVDALLGTGLHGSLKSIYREVIDRINGSKACVVSVDIPSGLDADTGFFNDTCVFADHTVTFQLPKAGLLINEGPEACGRLTVKDISIPRAALSGIGLGLNLIEENMVRELLPARKLNTHKGSFGSVFIVACSKGMEGSGLMASIAALRSGAGTVRLGMPRSLQRPLAAPEVMTVGLEDNDEGVISERCIPQLFELAGKSTALLIGPGLTSGKGTAAAMREVIRKGNVPLIIDADGLNAISGDTGILKEKRREIVITPHPGEMAKLCGCKSDDIQRDRLGYAGRFAEEYGVIVVLKGYRTVIALPDGRIFINPTGNSGMATAGSGDVLAGVITGLAAQGIELAAASVCGVYIHGAAGDLAAGHMGEFGLTAGDIINNIPHTIKGITGK